MNKYLEKIASWQTEELEKEAAITSSIARLANPKRTMSTANAFKQKPLSSVARRPSSMSSQLGQAKRQPSTLQRAKSLFTKRAELEAALEKEALWGFMGRQISKGALAMGGKAGVKNPKLMSSKMHNFGQDVIKGKGYARAALGGGLAATGLGAYVIAKD